MFSVPELPARLRPHQERAAELRPHWLPFETCNGEASHTGQLVGNLLQEGWVARAQRREIVLTSCRLTVEC